MLQEIVNQFFPYHQVANIQAFGNGHINDTYKVDLRGEADSYILQRINTQVFPDPEGICDTHLRLQEVFSKQKADVVIADLIATSTGKYLYRASDGGAWRMTSFIRNSYSVDVVEEKWQAYEAGKGYGWFAKACDILDAKSFKEAIRDFHKLSFRLKQLHDAIDQNLAQRLDSVKSIVDFFLAREDKLRQIESMLEAGLIPLRVVHNDTKINNLLFTEKRAAAVIDLDTVGPGIIFYDYGDALRTSANMAAEDEKDLDKVGLNLMAFTAFSQGYIAQVKSILNRHEEENLYLAPVLMTYIMGIRFLADYLNGDVYYKIAHKEHNLDRCKVQKKLIESMESHQQAMQQVIEKALTAIPETH